MQDAEENVRGSEVVKTEHISVIENALFFVYNANSFEYPLHSGRIPGFCPVVHGEVSAIDTHKADIVCLSGLVLFSALFQTANQNQAYSAVRG